MKMEERTVKVKFGGDIDGVSVETFTAVLLGYTRALTATAKEIDPNLVLDVEITATQPGCLEAILKAAVTDLPGLLASITQLSDQIRPVVETLNGCMELRRFLGKNGAPKEIERNGDGYKVIAQNGSNVTVNSFVMKASGSDEVDRALASAFGALASNDRIESIDISRPAGAHFSAPASEFDSIKTAPRCELESERIEIVRNASLFVAKPMLALSDQRKWEFIWRGEKLSAFMGDFDFLKKLANREVTFGIGDSILADLELTQRRNEIGAWVNRKVRVINVRGLEERGEEKPIL